MGQGHGKRNGHGTMGQGYGTKHWAGAWHEVGHGTKAWEREGVCDKGMGQGKGHTTMGHVHSTKHRLRDHGIRTRDKAWTRGIGQGMG